MDSKPKTNGGREAKVISFIPEAPITEERKPFLQADDDIRLPHAGTPRANLAPTYDCPKGTTRNNWAENHRDQTVLQQHVEFFDQDRDGIIWPLDTYRGLRSVGFNILLSMLSMFIIHVNFSYPTVPGYLPDPFFRLWVKNIHKDKHGSDSGTYDTEGRFVSQKFEEMFSKYAEGRDYVTLGDIWKLLKGQRLVADPMGWAAGIFEWFATYVLIWPEDGKIMKEELRQLYDGSLFFEIAKKRQKSAQTGTNQGMN